MLVTWKASAFVTLPTDSGAVIWLRLLELARRQRIICRFLPSLAVEVVKSNIVLISRPEYPLHWPKLASYKTIFTRSVQWWRRLGSTTGWRYLHILLLRRSRHFIRRRLFLTRKDLVLFSKDILGIPFDLSIQSTPQKKNSCIILGG